MNPCVWVWLHTYKWLQLINVVEIGSIYAHNNQQEEGGYYLIGSPPLRASHCFTEYSNLGKILNGHICIVKVGR